MKEKTEKTLERTLKALANRRRLSIVRLVKKEKEITVGNIADKIKLSLKATSKHIGILALADILEKEQRSTQIFYRISPDLPEVARQVLSFL